MKKSTKAAITTASVAAISAAIGTGAYLMFSSPNPGPAVIYGPPPTEIDSTDIKKDTHPTIEPADTSVTVKNSVAKPKAKTTKKKKKEAKDIYNPDKPDMLKSVYAPPPPEEPDFRKRH